MKSVSSGPRPWAKADAGREALSRTLWPLPSAILEAVRGCLELKAGFGERGQGCNQGFRQEASIPLGPPSARACTDVQGNTKDQGTVLGILTLTSPQPPGLAGTVKVL